MYVPAHFALSDSDSLAVLARMGAGDLVTVHAGEDGRPRADVTFLPWDHVPSPAAGEGAYGSLVGHLARNNPQVRVPVVGPATVIVHDGDHYVSPADLPSHEGDGRVVPTWDYVTVHAHGELVLHDDPAWILPTMRALTRRHEEAWVAGMPPEAQTTWAVEDAPADHIEKMLRAVVGVEVRITALEGKAKMSQNKTPADVEGEIAALEARGMNDLAAYKREISLPAARRRHELLAGLRERR